MIASQCRASSGRRDGIECIQPSGRALRHTNSNCSIQSHDGRWRGLHQCVVEKNDPLPVSLFGSTSSHVTGNNRCLQSIVFSFTTQVLCVFEGGHPPLNLRVLP